MIINAYVEHVALRVKDIQWHIDFFSDVLGMQVSRQTAVGEPLQIWLQGGIQLIECADTEYVSRGQLGHLGIVVDNLDDALERAYSWGVTALPKGRNWFALPEGVWVELMAGKSQEIIDVLAINTKK
jgi:catechol 2,3-dioxygenase-like lactoylglutathione lyase family enzyme